MSISARFLNILDFNTGISERFYQDTNEVRLEGIRMNIDYWEYLENGGRDFERVMNKINYVSIISISDITLNSVIICGRIIL